MLLGTAWDLPPPPVPYSLFAVMTRERSGPFQSPFARLSSTYRPEMSRYVGRLLGSVSHQFLFFLSRF